MNLAPSKNFWRAHFLFTEGGVITDRWKVQSPEVILSVNYFFLEFNRLKCILLWTNANYLPFYKQIPQKEKRKNMKGE